MGPRFIACVALIALACAPSTRPPTSEYCPLPTRPWVPLARQRGHEGLEGYVPSVQRGNQEPLGSALPTFARYVVRMHNRIHPIFAEDFIGSLCALPEADPINNPALFTRLEIVLEREEGRIIRMGVVKGSGVPAFDAAAFDSVARASPFGRPDPALLSNDGNLYCHWELHRDPVFACAPVNARPFLLVGLPVAL